MTLPLPSHHPPQAENPGSRTCNDDNLNNWGKLKTTTNLHHWTCPLHRQARCKTCQKKDKRREWTIFTETWFQRKIWQEDVETWERCSLWRKYSFTQIAPDFPETLSGQCEEKWSNLVRTWTEVVDRFAGFRSTACRVTRDIFLPPFRAFPFPNNLKEPARPLGWKYTWAPRR